MKKIIKVIACAALAGCMLVPFAGCADSKYQSEIDSLQAQIRELESKLDNNSGTSSDNSELLEMLSDLQSEISALKSQISELKGTNSGLNTEVTALKSKIEELKSTNSGLNSDITALQNKINELKSVNSQLEAEIASLQGVIDELQQSDDLFTGSPKFNYEIDETIPYYINGTKIFDFKITEFVFNDNATIVNYSITFAPEFNENLKQSINIRLYDTVSKTVYTYNSHSEGEIIFTSVHSGAETIINLLFHDITFATILATPTRVSNYA